jgi:hypothetical protein
MTALRHIPVIAHPCSRMCGVGHEANEKNGTMREETETPRLRGPRTPNEFPEDMEDRNHET